jgi:type II secretory pathway pseudopilin PulG
MRRQGFSLLELILVCGIIILLATLIVPAYHNSIVRTDLVTASEQITRGLGRARLLAETSAQDSQWGFDVASGTLFKGTSYTTRDSTFDEHYYIPSTIEVSGILQISYQKLTGIPSTIGTITLTTQSNEKRTVIITIEPYSMSITQGDSLTICHLPKTHMQHTLIIPDAALQSHMGHGDTMGACTTGPASFLSPLS